MLLDALATWSKSSLAPLFLKLSRGKFGFSAARAKWMINPGAIVDDGKYLQCSTPEAFALIAVKTIESLAYVLRYNPEVTHIFRTNSSSYVQLEGLARFVQNNPSLTYGGVLGESGGLQFASGAGTLLSRRAAEILIENSERVRLDLIDDVAMAKLLKENGLAPVSIPRVDMLSAEKIRSFTLKHREIPPECFHARCKDGGHTPLLLEQASLLFNSQAAKIREIDEDV